MNIKQSQVFNNFALFLFIHIIVWVTVPTLTNSNLPLDTIEALAWASNLDWGFNKHPPLSAFLVEIIYQIFGNIDWAYYLLSQLCIATSFLVIWKFSEDFFKNKIYSLISVLLLEGIYFYNYTTPEFNVYVCAIPFWALTVLFCWKGIEKNSYTSWLLFGFFSGFGVLSHYLFIYLLAAFDILFIYLIIYKKFNFKCLVSLVTFFLVLLPHIFWLMDNNYATITYATHRTGIENSNTISNHLIFPIIFLGKQIAILMPFLIMFSFIISKIKIKINFKDKKLLFLMSVTLVPLVLMFLTSVILGVKIRTMWMTPFYLFIGVLLIYIYRKRIILKKLKYFFSSFVIFFIFSPLAYSYVSVTQTDKRTDYPGKEISQLVQERWNNNFKNKINIVVGDEWYGGNLSYHLSSRPKWFNKLGPKIENLEFNKGVIYIGNADILEKVCPGIFGKIKPHGICMIGSK